MQNILRNIKTTLAGLASICGGLGLLAPELQKLSEGKTPDPMALKAGGAAIALGVGLLFAKDGDKTGLASKPARSSGPAVPPAALALLVGGALLFAAPARAQDAAPGIVPPPVSPAGTAPFAPFDLGKGFKLDPFAGLGGTVWDVAHGSVARSYQLGLGLELRKDGIPVGLAASGNLQLGDIVAGSATGGFTLADARFGIFQDLGLGVNVAVASKVASWGPSIFRIFRYSGL